MKDTLGMAEPVIVARDLNLVFQTNDGPVHALKDVNLTINRGDFVSFIGPSGCGKTTFLRAIAALEHPTGGVLTVNGMTPDEARRKRAYGYVFQAAGLYPWRTIAGNIRLPLEIMGFSKDEQEERIAQVLDLVELSGFGKKFPWQLSGGMQRRLGLAPRPPVGRDRGRRGRPPFARQPARRAFWRHADPGALARLHQSIGRQRRNGLAHHRPADAENRGHLAFGRQLAAGTILAGADALTERTDYKVCQLGFTGRRIGLVIQTHL